MSKTFHINMIALENIAEIRKGDKMKNSLIRKSSNKGFSLYNERK